MLLVATGGWLNTLSNLWLMGSFPVTHASAGVRLVACLVGIVALHPQLV